MACLFAVIAWREIVNGQSNRTQGGCFVQFAFGVMLMPPELLRVVRNELQHRRNTNGAHLGMVEHET
jgi:hypothetical protein